MEKEILEKQESRTSVWELLGAISILIIVLIFMFYASAFIMDFVINGANKVSQNVSALRTY